MAGGIDDRVWHLVQRAQRWRARRVRSCSWARLKDGKQGHRSSRHQCGIKCGVMPGLTLDLGEGFFTFAWHKGKASALCLSPTERSDATEAGAGELSLSHSSARARRERRPHRSAMYSSNAQPLAYGRYLVAIGAMLERPSGVPELCAAVMGPERCRRLIHSRFLFFAGGLRYRRTNSR
jgi:hypothetical protein